MQSYVLRAGHTVLLLQAMPVVHLDTFAVQSQAMWQLICAV